MTHAFFTRATKAMDALEAMRVAKNPTDFARRLKGFSDENIADALDLDPGVLSTKKDPAKFAAKLSKNVLPHLITRQAGAKWVDDLLDVDKREASKAAALRACSPKKLLEEVRKSKIFSSDHSILFAAVEEGRIRLEDLADLVVDGVPGFDTMVRSMPQGMKLDLMCLPGYQDRFVAAGRTPEWYIPYIYATDPRVVQALPVMPLNSLWGIADEMLVSDQVPLALAEKFVTKALGTDFDAHRPGYFVDGPPRDLSPEKEDLAFRAFRGGASKLLPQTAAAALRLGSAPPDVMEEILTHWMPLANKVPHHKHPKVTARTWRAIISRFKDSPYSVASYRLDDAELPLMDDFMIHKWPVGILSQVVDYKIRTNPDEARSLMHERIKDSDPKLTGSLISHGRIDLDVYEYTEEHLPILAELCWYFNVSLPTRMRQEVLQYTFGGADRDTVRVVCDMATEQDLSLEEAQELARSLS